MTDLEMTQLCAVAVGYHTFLDRSKYARPDTPQSVAFVQMGMWAGEAYLYDPLHNDAQMAALQKQFRLHTGVSGDHWWALCPDTKDSLIYRDDLNRAVVECVARRQGRLSL